MNAAKHKILQYFPLEMENALEAPRKLGLLSTWKDWTEACYMARIVMSNLME